MSPDNQGSTVVIFLHLIFSRVTMQVVKFMRRIPVMMKSIHLYGLSWMSLVLV